VETRGPELNQAKGHKAEGKQVDPDPGEQTLKEVEERIKAMVKEILETLMREEREIYLEEHLTKANGYYTRDLLTLIGPLEDLSVVDPKDWTSFGPPLESRAASASCSYHLASNSAGVK